MTQGTGGPGFVPHVIDWSSASSEWTSDGFELSVSLSPAATMRQAVSIADALEGRFAHNFRDSEITVVSVEPDGDERPLLLITSADLFAMNPHGLRDLMNAVADDTANEVVAVEARDASLAETWLAVLRK